MSGQLTIFDTFPTVRDVEKLNPEYPSGFWEWLPANESIYVEFVALALDAKRAGFPHYGANAILEHIRWRTALRDGYSSRLKVNNNASPGLSRLAMAEYPDLLGFFVTRAPPASAHAVHLNGLPYVADHIALDSTAAGTPRNGGVSFAP